LPEGAPFTSQAWDAAKTNVLARLRADGYAAASWIGTGAEVDPQDHAVRVFVVVDSGPLYRAGTIEVIGLQLQDAAMVRSQAGFGTGAALSEQRLQDYQERLSKTGLFDQVTVSMDTDPEHAAASAVTVRLREASKHTATTSVGISANSGPRAAIEHVNRRFLGWALTSREKLEWGRDRKAVDAELSTHPDAAYGRNLTSLAVERLTTSVDMVLSQRLRVGRALDHPLVERLNFVEAERAESCDWDGQQLSACDTLRALSVNTHSSWRRVDNVLLPTEGYTLSSQLGVGLSTGDTSRRGGFGRLYGRITGYWQLGSWYTQGRLEAGKVLTAAGVQVPDSLRFRAGGDNSVRGYAWRTLAPTNSEGSLTGGRLLTTASLEAAHPIVASLPTVWGAVFIDAGRAADRVSELRPALGYGLGVRWRSPVGPLSLDWAWGQEVHRGRLHLNVGVAF
jgi:translocation and assembly module TamA